MVLAKINYINEMFTDCDYVDISNKFNLKIGNIIIVSSNSLLHIAKILEFVDELDNKKVNTKFVRLATKRDLNYNHKNIVDSSEALAYAEKKALEFELPMHFISSFYTFDRKQLFLSYVADNRIDFRELAKALAQRYKTRIELRQIGVRDRAKKIGGLGPCGLFLCCSTFLTDFASVSINMAKNQFLALNPTKINGSCGRLLCCLNYEDEVYTELKEGLPSIGSLVETKEGLGKVMEVDVFKRTYKAEFKDKGVIEFSVNE